MVPPDPFRWRWEVEIRGSIIDDGTVVTVVNGDDYWEYDDRSKSVRRGLMRVVPDGIMLLPTYHASVGPVGARTVDSLVDQLRESGDYSEVGHHGEATVLGRTTRVVGFRSPAHGVVRAWVDPERMFIMRWAGELGGSGGTYASAVTALEYDTEHDERTFGVDPPAGARADAMCDASTYPIVGVSGGAPSLPREPGFLTHAYTPGGYRSVATGSEEHAGGGCGPVALWALLEAPDGSYLVLRQRLVPAVSPRWRSPEAGSNASSKSRRAAVHRRRPGCTASSARGARSGDAGGTSATTCASGAAAAPTSKCRWCTAWDRPVRRSVGLLREGLEEQRTLGEPL